MQSVECVEGVGKIDNSPIRTGLSYLINTVTYRKVRNVYWRNNLAKSLSLRLFVLYLLSALLCVITDRYSNLSTTVTVQILQ